MVLVVPCIRDVQDVIGAVPLELLGDVALAEVHVVRADVERLVLHHIRMADREPEPAGNVADLDERALEIRLVDEQVIILEDLVHEIIDEQVEAHAGGDAECRREPEYDRVRRVLREEVLLRVRLRMPIDRQRA